LPPIGIRNIFTTGWLTDLIAYLHMTEMSNKSEKVHNSINDFFERYGSAKGFVIDIRDNIGGYSIPVKELAERFTDEKRLYAISRLRNPVNIFSFQEPEYWTIEPCSGKNYNDKPVALLINGNTQSAAELFALMMKTLPNITLMGNTTSGVFADTHISKLPNGWEYRMSVRKTTDSKDVSLEDIGIIPDILIENTKKDIDNGKDKVIEHAIKYLSSGIKMYKKWKIHQ
jgi:C-terminal processing protease CtpA/Prc